MHELAHRHHGPSLPVVPGYPPVTIMKGQTMYNAEQPTSRPHIRSAYPGAQHYAGTILENAEYGTPRKRHSRWPWFVGAFLLLCSGVGTFVIIGAAGGGHAPAASGFTTNAAAPHTLPAAPAAKRKAAGRPTIGGDGGYLVGTDVKAGKYRTPGAADGLVVYCMWTVRAGGPDGEPKTYGVVDKTTAPGNVTLAKGQYFETQGCHDWIMR